MLGLLAKPTVSPPDAAVKAKLEPYAALVHSAENVPLGETLTTLPADDCVYGECTLGDLLVDAMNEFVSPLVD